MEKTPFGDLGSKKSSAGQQAGPKVVAVWRDLVLSIRIEVHEDPRLWVADVHFGKPGAKVLTVDQRSICSKRRLSYDSFKVGTARVWIRI